MSKLQKNFLNEYQTKILQCIKDGISHQQDINKNLGLENHLVNYSNQLSVVRIKFEYKGTGKGQQATDKKRYLMNHF